MMSHMYEGLLRNTISETGSEIPGHSQDWIMPVTEKSSQFLVGGRYGVGSCLFFFARGKRGTVKTKIHLQFLLANSHFTIHIASWHY